MSSVVEVVELATQNSLSVASLVVSYATWRQQRSGRQPSGEAVQVQDKPPSAPPGSRGISLAARLTGDSERYTEEWAAEWHDLPRRPRRIRAIYLTRISTRAIPIGVIAWSRKRRKA
ncbi:hypothetical protein [Streptomyces sp. NPDC059071]|uniref:effector-associated constant component EACC1 n=1 Tax=unclassified Streptomyces TaxID=2593676 RepID=UPI00365DDDD6